ncbi:MAG: hypothetical protein JWO88_1153 [Frankiales bacterium]|jgi:hypothetical protein|nr:hypothetical protein [Frankiales bacterium]
MYTVETVESLQSYGRRLRSDRAQFSSSLTPRRSTVRDLVRRVRRTV